MPEDNNNHKTTLVETKSQFDKFVIYLPKKFFNKSSIFKSIYERIKKKLNYKGIMTFNIDEYAEKITRLNKYCDSINSNLLYMANEYEHEPCVDINYILKDKFGDMLSNRKFDDLDYPSTNVLYIHLFGGYYYNDKIYAKKKFDLERELLFFIAGNLGVSKITYTITNKETVIKKIKTEANVKSVKNKVHFTSTHTEKNSQECVEVYENNGAPIFFDANGDIEKLEKEIMKSLEPINSPVFNYGFYKSNPKMVAFVCKRFFFKMHYLDYSSESEDISELSLTVQTCFADCGLQVAFESSTIITEKVTYRLDFHSEKALLEIYFQKKKYIDSAGDPFIMIRKFFDEDKSSNKDDSRMMIKKYIIELAGKCYYKIKGATRQYTFSRKLDDFIKRAEAKLSIKYKNFYTTRDIKKWFSDNLLNRNKEVEVVEDFDNDLEYLDNPLDTVKTTKNINIQESSHPDIHANDARIASLEEQLKEARQVNISLIPSTEAQSVLSVLSSSTHNNDDEPTIDNIHTDQEHAADVANAADTMMNSNDALEVDESLTDPEPATEPEKDLEAGPMHNTNINKQNTPNSKQKHLEELMQENENELNQYMSLFRNIINLEHIIKNKTEELEKFKNANKDKLTEYMIEVSSCHNAIQSLKSRKVMEQIKQTSATTCNLEEEKDTFDKIKCMFSRGNAAIINLDKQISKLVEKSNKLDEDIAKIKTHMESIQSEINKFTKECNKITQDKSNLEQELTDRGFKLVQLEELEHLEEIKNNTIKLEEDRISNYNRSCITISKKHVIPPSPVSKSGRNISRTLSTKSENTHKSRENNQDNLNFITSV